MVELKVGTTVLSARGQEVVRDVQRNMVRLGGIDGDRWVAWTDLGSVTEPDAATRGVVAIDRSLQPEWDALTAAARSEAILRWMVVMEILTGFTYGLSELALDGEPYKPFGPGWGASLSQRCARMAELLSESNRRDPSHRRERLLAGLGPKTISHRTLMNWVRAWERDGLLGLVDGRRQQRSQTFELLPAEFKSTAQEVVGALDGDYSTVNKRELMRRITVQMLAEGHRVDNIAARASASYVRWLMVGQGRTTRAQRTRKLREVSGVHQVAALAPGSYVAIDMTRVDVLVYSKRLGGAISVELITVMDVATRCVLAMRVAPKSADAQDVCLALWDTMRPQSQVVEGTRVSDWRWAGVPEVIDFSGLVPGEVVDPSLTGGQPTGIQPATTQGTHHIPGVLPAAIRCDHGSVFVSATFREMCARFGIDLHLNRGTRPTDNAFLERFHETLQGAYQQLPGYKGRNVSERGKRVGKLGAHEDQPLLTAAELERFLRAWVALEYHRRPHSGLRAPGGLDVDLTPLEMFDALLHVSGRLHVPQRPDTLYDFLPVRWGTVHGSGTVEFEDLVYGCEELREFRNTEPGRFRPGDRKMPFYYDPHDVTRVWFRHPETRAIVEVPWRGAHLIDAPLTDVLLKQVKARIVQRDGRRRLRQHDPEKQIIAELGSLLGATVPKEWRARTAAAERRVEASRADHAEARAASADHAKAAPTVPVPVASSPGEDGPSIWDDEWPDLTTSTERDS